MVVHSSGPWCFTEPIDTESLAEGSGWMRFGRLTRTFAQMYAAVFDQIVFANAPWGRGAIEKSAPVPLKMHPVGEA